VTDADVEALTDDGRSGGTIVEQLVESQIRTDREAEQEENRKHTRRPSEERRARRKVSTTFPTPQWRDAVLHQADRWGIRLSDFMTFCVAFTMRAIESGELSEAPRSGPTRFYHRAGENLDLPWSPEWSEEEMGNPWK
jgi:hypothetical protein